MHCSISALTHSLLWVSPVQAHVCVQQTALDLVERGFTVHVLADGVASRSDLHCTTALARMRDSGVFVTSSEAVLFELMKGKECP